MCAMTVLLYLMVDLWDSIVFMYIFQGRVMLKSGDRVVCEEINRKINVSIIISCLCKWRDIVSASCTGQHGASIACGVVPQGSCSPSGVCTDIDSFHQGTGGEGSLIPSHCVPYPGGLLPPWS